jgi:hypothetical protein
MKLRFTIRDSLWLMIVLALALGWSAYQLNWIRQRHEYFDRIAHDPFIDGFLSNPSNKQAPWRLRLFGELPYSQMVAWGPEDTERAKELFPEAEIIDMEWLQRVPGGVPASY